jgi:hypothetical protein
MRQASEQAKWPPQYPGGPESSECIPFSGRSRSLGVIAERIVGLFCKWGNLLIHSQIIIASTERPSHASTEAPSLFSFVPSIAPRPARNCPRATLHKPADRRARSGLDTSPCPAARRSWPSGSGPSTTGARPDSTTRCHRAVTHGIDQRAEAAMPPPPIASERRTRSWQRSELNAEGGVGGNETSNIKGGIGRESWVTARRDKASRGMVEWVEEVR